MEREKSDNFPNKLNSRNSDSELNFNKQSQQLTESKADLTKYLSNNHSGFSNRHNHSDNSRIPIQEVLNNQGYVSNSHVMHDVNSMPGDVILPCPNGSNMHSTSHIVPNNHGVFIPNNIYQMHPGLYSTNMIPPINQNDTDMAQLPDQYDRQSRRSSTPTSLPSFLSIFPEIEEIRAPLSRAASIPSMITPTNRVMDGYAYSSSSTTPQVQRSVSNVSSIASNGMPMPIPTYSDIKRNPMMETKVSGMVTVTTPISAKSIPSAPFEIPPNLYQEKKFSPAFGQPSTTRPFPPYIKPNNIDNQAQRIGNNGMYYVQYIPQRHYPLNHNEFHENNLHNRHNNLINVNLNDNNSNDNENNLNHQYNQPNNENGPCKMSSPEPGSIAADDTQQNIFPGKPIPPNIHRKHAPYHECPVCGKRIKRISSLRVHLFIHTKARPFKCQWEGCKKSFNVKSNLNRHVRLHLKKSKPDEVPSDKN